MCYTPLPNSTCYLVTKQTKAFGLETWVKVGGEGRMAGRGRPRAVVSDEIRATIIDRVVNHGLSLREDALRVQPNLQCSTVTSIVFWQNNRWDVNPSMIQELHITVQDSMFTFLLKYIDLFFTVSKGCLPQEGEAQYIQIVAMVTGNNATKLQKTGDRVLTVSLLGMRVGHSPPVSTCPGNQTGHIHSCA